MAQTSNRPMTLGIIVGNRGFFPGHLASEGRREMIAALTAKGIKPIAAGRERFETRRGGVSRGLQKMRRPLQKTPRRNRRRCGHAAELRRRTRHREHPAMGGSRRSRPDAGHAGHALAHADHPSARQLLRKNVGLQQPRAVRNSLFANHAAHGSARLGHLRQGFGLVPRRLPRRQRP